MFNVVSAAMVHRYKQTALVCRIYVVSSCCSLPVLWLVP